MSTITDSTAGTHHAASYTGAGTGLSGIPRAGLAAGTANAVVVNDGSGNLTSASVISAAQGGTGQNTSAASGVVKLTAGTWAFGGTITDSDIATNAAIERSKIASGVASQIVSNDGSGNLTSIAQIAPDQGGTGTDTSAITGAAKVSSGTWSFGANITDSDIATGAAIERSKIAAGTASQVVTNDGSGNLTSLAVIGSVNGGTGQNTSATSGGVHLAGGTWSFGAVVVDGDIATGANIERSKIASGSINQVVTNSGTGALTSVAQVAASQGGTGTDTSAVSGGAHITAGAWTFGAVIVDGDISTGAAIERSKIAAGTVSQIVANDSSTGLLSSVAQVGSAQGGTGLDSSAQSGGVHLSSGTWTFGSVVVDGDIATGAAIQRSKIAAGTANQIVSNNGSGLLTSVAQVAPVNGGTGTDTSAVTGGAHIAAGTWSFGAVIVDGDIATGAAIERSKIAAGTASQIVANNGSGALTSVAQVAPINGGTGTDTSATTGGAHITAGTWTFGAVIVDGDIATGAAIERSKIASSTANTAVVNDVSGNLASVAQISPQLGGTGVNTSSTSGGVHLSGGTWSFGAVVVDSDIAAGAAIERSKIAAGIDSQIVANDTNGNLTSLAQVPAANGGTGVDSSAQSGGVHLSSGTWTFGAVIVDGDISTSAAIERSKIAAGTANQVVTNNGSGLLTSVAQVAASQGGTGADSSAVTGGAHITAGTWTFGSVIVDGDIATGAAIQRGKIAAGTASQVVINNGSGALASVAQVTPNNGGTGLDTSTLTGGVHINGGTWSVGAVIVDGDISTSAAIERSKIATGTANYVVVNSGTGALSQEQYLATNQGGTGADFSGTGAGPFIVTSSSGAFAATLTYATAATASTIAERDSSGNLTANEFIANTSVVTPVVTTSGNLAVTATNVNFGTSIVHQTPTTIANSDSITYVADVQTTNATPTTLFSITTSNLVNQVYSIRALICCADHTGGANTGLISYYVLCKNLLGTLTANTPVEYATSLDPGFASVSAAISTSGANIIFTVTGLASTTIYWNGRFDVVTQQF